MIRLIAALGNPGTAYRRTRHNIGWMVLDHLPEAAHASWKQKFNSLTASLPGEGVILLKPRTYMNKSGISVAAALTYYSLTPDQLAVIHDDTELSFGEAVTRFSGGLKGHQGLRSIAQEVGSQEFYHIAMGIGRSQRKPLSSHVLGRFSPLEEAQLEDVLDRGVTLLRDLLAQS